MTRRGTSRDTLSLSVTDISTLEPESHGKSMAVSPAFIMSELRKCKESSVKIQISNMKTMQSRIS